MTPRSAPSRPRRRSGRFALAWGAAAVLTLPSAAAAQRGEDRILAEIRQIQSQLSALADAQNSLAEAVESLLADRGETLADERRSRAETASALERMEQRVSTLSESFTQADDRLSALLVEVEAVREAQRRAARVGATADAAGEAPGEAAGGGGEPADSPPAETADESPAEDEADEAPPGAVVLDEPSVSEIYLEAQADYLQGRYELAVAGFERVAAAGGELADNARYGIGEALLAVEQLEPALEQFEIVIRDFPDSNKVGEAWYKKGFILHHLGHESDARDIFEDILDIYAGTPAARAARRQLESLTPREPGD